MRVGGEFGEASSASLGLIFVKQVSGEAFEESGHTVRLAQTVIQPEQRMLIPHTSSPQAWAFEDGRQVQPLNKVEGDDKYINWFTQILISSYREDTV